MSEEQVSEPMVSESSPEPAHEAEPSQPESYNIYSEEPSPIMEPTQAEPVQERMKSKEFLENVRRDKELRKREIGLKEQENSIRAQREEFEKFQAAKKLMEENPSEFFRSQGMDPMGVYKDWTHRMIQGDNPSLSPEQQIGKNSKEVEALKAEIARRDQAAQENAKKAQSNRAYQSLVGEVEQFATSSEGFEHIKESCSAQDVVNGMITYYRQTGEQLEIKEAFEKIEAGLRKREEEFYQDPKVLARLEKYYPGATKRVKGSQATLSSRWREQTTRTESDDMSLEDLKEMYKGKLFT
jgi:hypothetical protein